MFKKLRDWLFLTAVMSIALLIMTVGGWLLVQGFVWVNAVAIPAFDALYNGWSSWVQLLFWVVLVSAVIAALGIGFEDSDSSMPKEASQQLQDAIKALDEEQVLAINTDGEMVFAKVDKK